MIGRFPGPARASSRLSATRLGNLTLNGSRLKPGTAARGRKKKKKKGDDNLFKESKQNDGSGLEGKAVLQPGVSSVARCAI